MPGVYKQYHLTQEKGQREERRRLILCDVRQKGGERNEERKEGGERRKKKSLCLVQREWELEEGEITPRACCRLMMKMMMMMETWLREEPDVQSSFASFIFFYFIFSFLNQKGSNKDLQR